MGMSEKKLFTPRPFTPFNEMTDEEHDHYQQMEYEDMMKKKRKDRELERAILKKKLLMDEEE